MSLCAALANRQACSWCSSGTLAPSVMHLFRTLSQQHKTCCHSQRATIGHVLQMRVGGSQKSSPWPRMRYGNYLLRAHQPSRAHQRRQWQKHPLLILVGRTPRPLCAHPPGAYRQHLLGTPPQTSLITTLRGVGASAGVRRQAVEAAAPCPCPILVGIKGSMQAHSHLRAHTIAPCPCPTLVGSVGRRGTLPKCKYQLQQVAKMSPAGGIGAATMAASKGQNAHSHTHGRRYRRYTLWLRLVTSHGTAQPMAPRR